MPASQARSAALGHRRQARQAHRRARHHRVAEQRQDAARGQGRRPSVVRHLPLLRGLHHQDPRRNHPRRRRLPLLHAARAGGGLRSDRPLELSASHRVLEGRARAGGRQHRGAEAERIHAAHRARPRRDLPRSGAARRRRQRRPRLRRSRRRSAGAPPRRRQDRLHRQHSHRAPPLARVGRHQPEEALARARRKIAARHSRRRRRRRRGEGVLLGHLCQQGRSVLGIEPRHRSPQSQRSSSSKSSPKRRRP